MWEHIRVYMVAYLAESVQTSNWSILNAKTAAAYMKCRPSAWRRNEPRKQWRNFKHRSRYSNHMYVEPLRVGFTRRTRRRPYNSCCCWWEGSVNSAIHGTHTWWFHARLGQQTRLSYCSEYTCCMLIDARIARAFVRGQTCGTRGLGAGWIGGNLFQTVLTI